jgi:hypothetical protein
MPKSAAPLPPAVEEYVTDVSKSTAAKAAEMGLERSTKSAILKSTLKTIGWLGTVADFLWPEIVYAPTHGDPVLEPKR